MGPPATLAWSPNLVVAQVAAQSAGSTATFSSTRLALTWNAPSNLVPTGYELTLTEVASGASRTTSVTAANQQLSDLKSATSYRIEIRACSGSTCYAQPTATATAETPAEVWHLQGTGNTVAGLARTVSDGNVRLHALRLGEGAPPELAGHLRLYYGAQGNVSRGFAVAVSNGAATAANPASYLTFTSRAGTSGFVNPPSPATLVGSVSTGQGVALTAAQGGRIRVYFEGAGADNRTRIMSIDSQDGYAGLDFNAGPSGVCSTTADYSAGGGCAPSVAIGVEGDAVAGWPRVANARQFKIGVPTATDWRWDGAAGTFMVFTLDAVPGCSTASHNQAYAMWNGSAWQVQYEASGCPKMMPSMQAAHPLHLGGVRYKVYYGDPSITAGRVAGSPLPFLGPKKVLYADGAATGDAARVDFEDWEAPSRGREVRFLWPGGTELGATEEGYIDDFTVLTPTASMSLQVMYVAITDGTVAPFSASAVLLNP